MGSRVGLILVIIVTDIVLQWEDTREIQLDIDIGNQSDRYRLTMG